MHSKICTAQFDTFKVASLPGSSPASQSQVAHYVAGEEPENKAIHATLPTSWAVSNNNCWAKWPAKSGLPTSKSSTSHFLFWGLKWMQACFRDSIAGSFGECNTTWWVPLLAQRPTIVSRAGFSRILSGTLHIGFLSSLRSFLAMAWLCASGVWVPVSIASSGPREKEKK